MFLIPSVFLPLFTSSCNILSYYKNNSSVPFFQMNLLPWLKQVLLDMACHLSILCKPKNDPSIQLTITVVLFACLVLLKDSKEVVFIHSSELRPQVPNDITLSHNKILQETNAETQKQTLQNEKHHGWEESLSKMNIMVQLFACHFNNAFGL